MQTILITGGTGLVGKALTQLLVYKGYNVIILSRNNATNIADNGVHFARWNVDKKEMDITALQKADYIIHLAGAGVMDKKWTAAYKKEIIDSRVKSAELIAESLKNHPNKVKAVVSASASGWYKKMDIIHTEDEPADDSFLGTTCKLWEESIQPVRALNKRLVTLRLGIVLSKNGGALKEFIQPLKFGVAAILGSGKQIISWVHIEDLCRMFLFALENEQLNSIYNVVAPNPVSNKELTLTLAKKMRQFFIPVHVPQFIFKLILGNRSTEVLRSAAVSSKKAEAAGFKFQFETIDKALENLVKN
jgi:uncharacterized protein (TIGR01777 family)